MAAASSNVRLIPARWALGTLLLPGRALTFHSSRLSTLNFPQGVYRPLDRLYSPLNLPHQCIVQPRSLPPLLPVPRKCQLDSAHIYQTRRCSGEWVIHWKERQLLKISSFCLLPLSHLLLFEELLYPLGTNFNGSGKESSQRGRYHRILARAYVPTTGQTFGGCNLQRCRTPPSTEGNYRPGTGAYFPSVTEKAKITGLRSGENLQC